MRRSQCCMCDGWIDKPPFSVCDDCLPKGAIPPPLPPDEIRQLYALAGRPPSPSVPALGGVPLNGAVWSTKASPVEDLTAAFEEFRRNNPPPEPFTLRQIRQAIEAAKALGVSPESLLRALGQWPVVEPFLSTTIRVVVDPSTREDSAVLVGRMTHLPIVIDLGDVPPPSTECEDDIKARILKQAAEQYSKVKLP